MKLVAVSLVLIVGCRFELPEVVIDAPVDTPPVDVPADGPGCPADFAPLPGGPPGHLYRKVPLGSAPWLMNFNSCRSTSVRAYLAVPNDLIELMNLYDLAAASELWVGIDDRMTEGMFVSAETGGPATFLPWESGEPDNSPGGIGDCVLARPTTIRDYDCNISRPAICECNP